VDSEQVIRYVHDLRNKLGIVEANTIVLGEGLSPSEAAGALSDVLEAARAMRTMLDEMQRVEEAETTQEICPHAVTVKRAPAHGACPCCRRGTDGRCESCA
jgi:signal transduction histidine kinase